jgi:Ribonuclease G/E
MFKKSLIVLSLGLLLIPNFANANANKGKKIYMKKMKASCGFSGAKFAIKHTQDEWEKIKKSGKFSKEASIICPGLKLKSKYINDVYDFSYEYASDSGNVPSC